MVEIKPIPAFNDNYIWIITDGRYACAVDPGQKDPVAVFLQQHHLQLTSILITHHHQDHTGGVLALAQETGARVYGPVSSQIEGIDVYVQEGDTLDLEPLPLSVSVLEVPGHTLDHVAYWGQISFRQPFVFCGDTLFSCGCGRLFEGNSKQMLQSLDKLKKMSENTLVYCAHEYTLSNIRWALLVDSSNPDLLDWQIRAQELREQGLPTVPTTLGQELRTNPFLRANQRIIQQAAEQYAGRFLSSPADVLGTLREWKNHF
ncbi:hydroxyacylglutathione hydrolase [Pelistega europaea]